MSGNSSQIQQAHKINSIPAHDLTFQLAAGDTLIILLAFLISSQASISKFPTEKNIVISMFSICLHSFLLNPLVGLK